MKKPGEIVDRSGIYRTAGGREAALSKGDRFPPTARGGGWTAERLTKQNPPKQQSGSKRK